MTTSKSKNTVSTKRVGRTGVVWHSQTPTTAAPVQHTVTVSARCQHCQNDIGTTYDPTGQSYPWYHIASGKEECPA